MAQDTSISMACSHRLFKGGGSDDDDISIDGGSLECRIVIQCPRPGVD